MVGELYLNKAVKRDWGAQVWDVTEFALKEQEK